jgi:hypothetical protein
MGSETKGGMAIDYDESLDALVAIVSGPRDVEKAKADWVRLFAAFESYGTNKLLLDARLGEFNYGLDDWIAFTRELAEPITGKCISLVIRPDLRDFGVVARLSAEGGWNELRFFYEAEEARAWLDLDSHGEAES